MNESEIASQAGKFASGRLSVAELRDWLASDRASLDSELGQSLWGRSIEAEVGDLTDDQARALIAEELAHAGSSASRS